MSNAMAVPIRPAKTYLSDNTHGNAPVTVSGIKLPFIPRAPPDWLPDILFDKSTQDLKQILQDPQLLAAILDNPATSHPSIIQSQTPVEEQLQANIKLSQSVVELESQLNTLRINTQSRLLALKALEQQHRSKVSETEGELDQFSPMALYQKLHASVQEQNSLLKGLEDSFLEENDTASEKEVQDFVRKVREAKRLAFLRSERKIRWDEGRVGGWR